MIAGLALLAGGAAAGLFGSLLGLGGGILIVPMLTLGLGLPLQQAVAISLVSVIVTSSAAASVYLQRHIANLRLGMTLELFSATGALVGGLVAFTLSQQLLEGLFAALLIWVAISMIRRRDPSRTGVPAVGAGTVAAVAGTGVGGTAVGAAGDTGAAPSPDDAPPAEVSSVDAKPADPRSVSFVASLSGPGYTVHGLPAGIVGSLFAGLNSALLGVGGGIIKVPVMNLWMGVPLRVSTATSNMMMGITATASAVIYLLRGQLDPFIAGVVVLGVFAGASVGPRVAHRIDTRILRWLFVAVLAWTAYEMASKALGL